LKVSRARQFFLVSFPTLFLTVLNTGCLHTRPCQYSEAPPGQIFLSPHPNFEDAGFKRWDGAINEHARIKYLLERMALSNDRFIRNGHIHNGKKARQWFLYKMSYWVNGVGTAEDFVSRVATFSQKTGQPYLVEYTDGGIYSLGSVLKNELSAFDAQQNKLNELSISPTAVASTAVAASTSS